MREDHAHAPPLHRPHTGELLEWVPDAVVVSDSEGRIVFANGQTEALFGYSNAELIGQPVELLVPERLREMHVPHRRRYGAHPRARPMGARMDLVARRRDGTEFPVDISLSATGAGAGLLVTSFIRDVSGQRQCEQDLRQSEERSHAVLNSLDSHVIVVDGTGIIVAVNDAWRSFAAEGEPLANGGVGAHYADVCAWLLAASVRLTEDLEPGLAAVLAGSRRQLTLEYARGTARDRRWFLLKATPLAGGGGGMVVHHADVTRTRRAKQALREEERRDRLTGVLHHGAITGVLHEHIEGRRTPGPLAVAMADVDGLRTINETYGHGVGDAALVVVARALTVPGAIVGRYGGDEFVAVLPGADRRAGARYHRAVIDALAGPRINDPVTRSPISLGLKIGLAFYPDDARRIDELLRLADDAMYSSRRAGALDSGPSVRRLRDSRAAATISEVVSLSIADGDLREKLRLAAHRVAVAAGYDLVGIELFGEAPGTQAATAFADISHEAVVPLTRDHCLGTLPLRRALERARRPILIEHAADDQRFLPAERAQLEAAGVLSMLVVPVLWDQLLVGTLSVASRRQARFGPKDVRLLGTIAGQVANIALTSKFITEAQAAARRAKDAHAQAVMMLAATAEAHDQATGVHLRNVQSLCEALARELDYGDEAAHEVGLAAVLHDIGKIRVPKEILLSPDELSATEWEVVKQHTVWGAEFLTAKPMFERAAVIARCHHERWDGEGYPAGLRGDEIPEEAAIVAIVDAFEAMTHDRPYRPALALAEALERIAAGAGTQFSPRLVEAFLRMHEKNPLGFEQLDGRAA